VLNKKSGGRRFTSFGAARDQEKAGNSLCYLIVHGGGESGDVASETCQTTPLVTVTTGRRTAPISRGTELRLLSGSITHLRSLFRNTIGPHLTTFRMEGFTGETEAVSHYRCFCMSEALPVSTACSLSQTARLFHLAYIAIILGMGRRPWATPEQLEYLKSWLPLLPRAKKTTGLQTAYVQAYEGFLMKWQPHPVAPMPDVSPEQLATKAKEQLLKVRIELPYFRNPSQSASASSTGLRRSERRPN
jgi:hypothetical protein